MPPLAVGLPPSIALSPAQNELPAPALAIGEGLTVTVITLEFAVVVVAQDALLVSMHIIVEPLAGALAI